MAFRLKKRYNIEISTSDYYAIYEQYKIAKQHIMTKAEPKVSEARRTCGIKELFDKGTTLPDLIEKPSDIVKP